MADENQAETDNPPPPVREDIPDIFVDGYHGASLSNGVLRFNLTQNIYPPDPDTGFEKKVVARLVVPVAAFPKILETLQNLYNDLENDGIIRVVAKDGGDE